VVLGLGGQATGLPSRALRQAQKAAASWALTSAGQFQGIGMVSKRVRRR
jgi:aspartokinase-like uncharacterized kinase